MSSPNPKIRTLIAADDLTGACDAAVAFAQRGERVRVFMNGALGSIDEMDVCAVSTGTRDLSIQVMEERLSNLFHAATAIGFSRLFKKIDSVFRGNTVAEISAAIRFFGADLSLIAPAYPALGRTSEDGMIRVCDLQGECSMEALAMLRSADLHATLIAAGSSEESITAKILDAIRFGQSGIVYCDATQQAHLEAAVAAASRLMLNVLWIGSGGLAHALAAHHSHGVASFSAESGLVLIFAGSDHPVSKVQLQDLLLRKDIISYDPRSAPSTPITEAAAVLIPIIYGETSSAEIASVTQEIDPSGVSCLFMTGGDTAALVCASLGITAVDLRVEFEPGLPQGVAVGGRFEGCNVVLKSGGFGDAATIRHVVERFAGREEVCNG